MAKERKGARKSRRERKNVPHAVAGPGRFKMLLVMFKS